MSAGSPRTLAQDVSAVFRVVVAGAVIMVGMGVSTACLLAVDRSTVGPFSVDVIALRGAVLTVTGTVVLLWALRGRRRFSARVVDPIQALLEKMRAVGRGEFGVSLVMDAPAELLALRDELVDMSASLNFQQQVLASRAEDSALVAQRLRHVVAFAREVSSSLTLAHVMAAATTSARRLLDSPRARIWLLDEGGETLRLACDATADSADLRDPAVDADAVMHPVGSGGVGRAVTEHRLCYSLGLAGETYTERAGILALALPLVKGQRVVGVLEVALSASAQPLGSDTVEVLEAMASHTATAVDAARLYEQMESLSLSDPLTGLGNRRRLDQDLELELAARQDRPVAFLMVDVDHFKRVNDTFGHGVGDAVLCQLATLLGEEMRAGDSAYRYGGEEFAVLARETDPVGARAFAERLRQRVEQHYGGARGDAGPRVTVSIGITMAGGSGAGRPSADGVLMAADAALYDAKHSGRNRIAVAPDAVPRQRLALR